MLNNRLSFGYSILRNIHLVIFFLLVNGNVFSQRATITGTVTDSQTGEPIPFANIYIKDTNIGTYTDTLGVFNIKISNLKDTLRFTIVGYYPTERVIGTNDKSALLVQMKPHKIDISQITVTPNEGPVRKLLENVNNNKRSNNPDKYSKYSYRKYTKWEYQINNVNEKVLNSFAFRKNQSVFKTDSDSTKFLPLYFSEQLVFNEIQKNPLKQKSTIIADKTVGVGILDEMEISGYTSALDMEVNFYDNFINLFTQNFVSPIADNGWFYYKYFLMDSTVVFNHKEYLVNYRPRRSGENTFKGYLIIEDRNYSLVEIDATLSNTNSLNFLKNMRLKSNYAFANDSTPFYKRNQIDALFDYVPFKNPNKQKKRLSLYYTQSARVDQVTINPINDIVLGTPKAKFETIKLPDALDKDSLFWNNNRMEELGEKDKVANLVIDSITQIKSIFVANNLARMSMTGYYDVGKFEIGPFPSFFNTNKVEGVHLFFGGRTSDEISKRMMLWGGVGYGFVNKKINSAVGFGYKLPTNYRQVLKVSYDDKMIRNGENEKILNLYENSISATENNLMSQLLKHDPLDKVFREQKIATSYEYEWYPGLSNKLSASYTKHYSPQFYEFKRNNNLINAVSAVEIYLDTRMSKEEKIIDKGFLRMFMGTDYPIVHFTVGVGKTFYDNQSDYYGRVAATMKQYHNFGQTVFNYAIETGMYFGKLPYTMLDNPRGNETMGLYLYDFNMLNYLEFVHDKYIHTYVNYHLNGFFFRRVPLLKKANLREVLSARLMVGSVSDKHQQVITFPTEISKMSNPYIELGAGIENILSIMRIEAVWRIMPKSVVGAPMFGLRAKVELGL